MLESQTRGDQDLMPLGYEKSQFHMDAGSSPKYTEERKDLSMHDRRSSPHYQRKRANISYQGRIFYRRTDTRKILFCVKVKPGKGSVTLSANDRGVEGLFEFVSACAHSHSNSCSRRRLRCHLNRD